MATVTPTRISISYHRYHRCNNSPLIVPTLLHITEYSIFIIIGSACLDSGFWCRRVISEASWESRATVNKQRNSHSLSVVTCCMGVYIDIHSTQYITFTKPHRTQAPITEPSSFYRSLTIPIIMDIVQAVQTYVKRMFAPDNAGGAAGSAGKMKILLLDSETVCLGPYSHCV